MKTIEEFNDHAQIADYAKEAVLYLAQNGIMTGDGTNFKPLEMVSRQDLAVALYRVMCKG